MTVSADRVSRIDYVASAAQTTFPYTFEIYASTDLAVYQNDVAISSYTVSGVGDVAGGNVILATGATAGDTVSILCHMPISQGVDYVELDAFPAETHERALDKLTIIAQQQQEEIGRSLKFGPESTYEDAIVSDPVTGSYLRWSATSPPAIEATTITPDTGIGLPLATSDGGHGESMAAATGFPSWNAGTLSLLASVVDVATYATGGAGTLADPWTGWDALTWSGKRVYYFRPGHFTFTATIVLAEDDTVLQGSGNGATILHFEPTANDIALQVANGASMATRHTLRGFLLSSADTTYTKVGLDIVDGDVVNLSDFEIGPDGQWTGATSVGLRLRGRNVIAVNEYVICADLPIQFSDNPNSTIDADHYNFHNGYLIANGNPNILIDSGVNLTHCNFDGYQAWVRGTDGLKWVDTTSVATSISLRVCNARWEQMTGTTGYLIDIEHNFSLQQLVLENLYGGLTARGFKFRNCQAVSLRDCWYVGTGVALDADSDVDPNYNVMLENCFFQSGSTLSTTGLTKTYDSGWGTLSGTINNRVIYDIPVTTTEAHTMVNTTVSGRMKIPVVATASLPAAASAQDGLILIEDNGTGDRNLVIYAGAQRFRIDGGSSV